MRPPGFWRHGADGVAARLLAPLGAITQALTARRVARPGWRAPVPVICVGNATSGGAGKTTVALDLAARLSARGVAVHVLSRGHGGISVGPVRVDVGRHSAAEVGDEPLLLARVAPTWVARDRAAGARAAVAAGAGLLLLDDGLQNPTLEKSLSLLVIDGASGFGNGRLIPAGPLREPVAAAARRCQAAVLLGEDRTGALAALPAALPVLRARLVPDAAALALRGARVVAFAGIAMPEKFFASLDAVGAQVLTRQGFPDHHRFYPAELRTLQRQAAAFEAVLATTPKDAVRLPAALRAEVRVAGVGVAWEDAAALEQVLAASLC
jgi:tetraacyldisaccharide 4'-kinase